MENAARKASAAPSTDEPVVRTETVYMRRHMGFFRASGTIISSVIGIGIFLTPSGVALNMGSTGGTIIIWGIAGLVSAVGAISFLELGAMLPQAGGHYAFIDAAFGPALAFSVQWAHLIVNAGAVLVILGRATGTYLLAYTDPSCGAPWLVINLISVFLIFSIAALNIATIDWAAKIVSIFSVGKVIALAAIIIIGVVQLATDSTENFRTEKVFEGTTTNPGAMAVAVYSGYFSYGGWENLFVMQEEVKNPTRTLPRAVAFSMTIITLAYVMANVAYLSVMTPADIVASGAVAVTFAERALSSIVWIVSVCVAASAMGTMVTAFVVTSRSIFRCGRDGTLPRFLSMLNVYRMTPIPAILFQVVLGLIYHVVPDISTLVGYAVLVNQLQILLSFLAFFYMRWKWPGKPRPYRVSVIFPVVALLANLTFLVLAVIQDPRTYGVALGLYLTAFPVYAFNVYVSSRLACLVAATDAFMVHLQRFFNVVPECRENQLEENSKCR